MQKLKNLLRSIWQFLALIFCVLIYSTQFIPDGWMTNLGRDRAVIDFLDAVEPYMDPTAPSHEVELFEKTFSDAFDTVMKDYVDPPDATRLIEAAWTGIEALPATADGLAPKEITDATIAAMLHALTASSSYRNADFMREWQRVWRDEDYVGIGIRMVSRDGVVKVVQTRPGRPAERAGVRSGDRIMAVDGESVMSWSAADVALLVNGDVGTDVTLTLRRPGRDDFDVTVRRERRSRRYSETRLYGSIAYVGLFQVASDLAEQLSDDIARLQSQAESGPDGIVLDLRGASSSYVHQIVPIADIFLAEGVPIVSTEGGGGPEPIYHDAAAPDQVAGVPIVVLINEDTAGVMQALAGSLQANRRAWILGSASPGSAYDKRYHRLPNEGAMWIAARRVRMPDGRSLDVAGIEPDLRLLHDSSAVPRGRFIDVDRCPRRTDSGNPGIDCAIGVLGAGSIDRFLRRGADPATRH